MRTGNTKRSSQHAGALANGGKTPMFGPRSAGRDTPGRTGKVQTPAPGARSARGGTTKLKRPNRPTTIGLASAAGSLADRRGVVSRSETQFI
jgi:hypothetical protein